LASDLATGTNEYTEHLPSDYEQNYFQSILDPEKLSIKFEGCVGMLCTVRDGCCDTEGNRGHCPQEPGDQGAYPGHML
jgi:hypothetical protein